MNKNKINALCCNKTVFCGNKLRAEQKLKPNQNVKIRAITYYCKTNPFMFCTAENNEINYGKGVLKNGRLVLWMTL